MYHFKTGSGFPETTALNEHDSFSVTSIFSGFSKNVGLPIQTERKLVNRNLK